MRWFSTNTASSSHSPAATDFFSGTGDCLQVNMERLYPMYFSKVLLNFRRKFSRVQINYARNWAWWFYEISFADSLNIYHQLLCTYKKIVVSSGVVLFKNYTANDISKKVLNIPFLFTGILKCIFFKMRNVESKRLKALKGKVLVE